MKTFLLFGLVAFAPVLRSAETLTATITEPTKMEVTRGKGTIMLKAGLVVEVVSRDGDQLGVVYRNVTGVVPIAKTNFKGEVPKPAPKPAGNEPAKPREEAKPAASAKPAEPKAPEAKSPPSNREEPTSNYGKMVKKARDNEAKHRENLVDPTDSATGAK